MSTKGKLERMRKRAKEKNIEFNLTKQWLEDKLKINRCEITGIPFVYEPVMNPYYPVLDRKNNKKGYTKDNCVLILNLLNCAKGEFGLDLLHEWAKKFVKKYEEGV